MQRAPFWFLLVALLACLAACQTKVTRPSPLLEPPTIDCQEGETPDGPDWPDDWLRDGPAFAIAWLGIATEERRLRAIEHGCLDRHRKEGAIR